MNDMAAPYVGSHDGRKNITPHYGSDKYRLNFSSFVRFGLLAGHYCDCSVVKKILNNDKIRVVLCRITEILKIDSKITHISSKVL